MEFSRRHFIKLGASAAGVAGFGSFAFGQEKSFLNDDLRSALLADPLFGYTAKDFRKHLGTKFTIMTESAAQTAVLVDVKSSEASKDESASNKKAECFTLSFQTPSKESQATYTIFHPRLGTFNLFLVPGQSNKAESLLHAVVNRI